MARDTLEKWEKKKPGSRPSDDDVSAVAPPKAIKLREYKAFISDGPRSPMLVIKRGTTKRPETDLFFSYGYLASGIADGPLGQVFSLTFVLPMTSGRTVVLFEGEGLGPLLDGILRGAVSSVQIFDPAIFLPTEPGDWDVEGYKWVGPCVVRDISVGTADSPINTTKH